MNVLERLAAGGIEIKFTSEGHARIMVDPAKVAAASELVPLGEVQVYDVDMGKLAKDAGAEGHRFFARVKKWFARKP